MEKYKPGSVEDLATLAKLDDKVLLEELKTRYLNNNIYTYVGDILIAVNPFRDLGIYNKEETQRYFLGKRSSNPPHIFAVSDAAYQNITGYGGRIPHNQCILISGESGAGKTESTKFIIKQLIELCRGNTQLEQQILQVNPLLEAFGNAQTILNDNSSRFGKYIQLHFKEGHVLGAKISEYLLEKSRVVGQNAEEQNFHIFYYLFAGLTKETQQEYALGSPESYRYLSNGASCLKREKKNLQERYDELVNAMDMVGFTEEEQIDMFTVIASLLHLGNVRFDSDDNDAAYILDENGPIAMASKLLGIHVDEAVGIMTSMETFVAGEKVKRNYTEQHALDVRDAMSKAIYGRLFGWIVNKVNQLLAAPTATHADLREIGILDIFGFEHFEKNSFEQACINLANEQLQFFFNQHVFKLEQEEYTREGIDWKEIKFVDNQPLLDLFLVKPIGILSLLDEESHFPKGTDLSFVEKLNKNFTKNPYFTRSQQTTACKFTINHYAGKVTYDAELWLEKNRDTLPPGVMEMLQLSENKLVKLIFKGQITRTGTLALQARKSTSRRTRKSRRPTATDGGRKRKLTVGGQFKNSLQILMERMCTSVPLFVRCLKPNHIRAPVKFDEKYISAQLLYSGMLETIKIRREGFAVRPSFAEFVEKYKVILCLKSLQGSKENCYKILQATKIKGWQIGKTKVFLKYYHLEQLSDILVKMGKSAVHLQRVARGFLGRQECKRRRKEAHDRTLKVMSLMENVKNMAIHMRNMQQIVIDHDKEVPAGNVKMNEYGLPPPVPSFYGVPSTTSSLTRKYEEPQAKTSREFGTQADASSESEFSEDEFRPVSSTAFGTPGTKQATVRWFKETQQHQVVDPNVNFVSEWFHGVISRRQSEKLLGPKQIGCFLIRVSESRFGYSLSFRGEGRVRHYMIDQLPSKKFVIVGENKVHKTLLDIVAYHQKNKISNWDGYLTVPCGQENGECDYGELLSEDFYFQLEKQDVPLRTTHGIQRRQGTRTGKNSVQFSSRITSGGHPANQASSRLVEHHVPPLPERNYTVPRPDPSAKNSVSGRPLPKRPEEAYQRLLQNQAHHH